MKGLFKDGFGINNLKLGPKVPGMVGDAAAVGAATGVGKGKVFISDVFGKGTPIGGVLVYDLSICVVPLVARFTTQILTGNEGKRIVHAEGGL